MTCDKIESLLLDLIENELPPSQRPDIERHLAGCATCREKADDLRRMLHDLSAARSVSGGTANSGEGAAATPMTAPRRLGDFEILEEIGRGGMGVVYRARQVSLNRVVALKVLPPAFVHSDRSIVRFQKEAQAAARLHHTNIVPVYAQGFENGHFYYAMELITGQALSAVLRSSPLKLRLIGDEDTGATRAWSAESATVTLPQSQAPHTRQPNDPSASAQAIPHRSRRTRDFKRIARLIAEVADGLHHAHEAGVIHRDIKPQNLLLGDDNHLHITDFGLARLLDEPGVTMSFENVGTPAYMSPEQVSSEKRPVDGRSDVFSLGVTLYELLTRQRPFTGQSVNQIIHAILHREPTAPRKLDATIPADLETICLRALEKEPARRFPSAGEMARDLMRYAQDFPIASRRIGVIGKSWRWVRRNPARAAAASVTTLLLFLIPVLGIQVNSIANSRIQTAETILLNNYRDGDRAIEALGWAKWFGGNRFRADRTRLFASIRPRSGKMPPETLRSLAALVQKRPEDADTRYLYAWALHWSQSGDAAVAEQVAIAERYTEHTTHIGWFFRGQAELESVDPEGANEHFQKAIDAAARVNSVFLQAKVHQARAINYIMYYLRDDQDYSVARRSLDSALDLKPGDAYYLYLRTYCHKLAAEIAAERGFRDIADERFRLSLADAQRSRELAPQARDGYAAEAGIREALGDFEAALAAWRRHDAPDVQTSDDDRLESAIWSMRLLFWLGRYDEALEQRQKILGNPAFIRSAGEFSGTMALHGALLELSAGRRQAAEQLTRDMLTSISRSRQIAPSERMILSATLRICGTTPDASVLPQLVAVEHPEESDNPDRRWEHALYAFERGDIDWVTLLHRAESVNASDHAPRDELPASDPDKPPVVLTGRERIQRQSRLAAAWFLKGTHELGDGNREEAVEAFRRAAESRDLENYCFLGRMLYEKLIRDPSWPAW